MSDLVRTESGDSSLLTSFKMKFTCGSENESDVVGIEEKTRVEKERTIEGWWEGEWLASC